VTSVKRKMWSYIIHMLRKGQPGHVQQESVQL
jgi:hypothetical protein